MEHLSWGPRGTSALGQRLTRVAPQGKCDGVARQKRGCSLLPSEPRAVHQQAEG